MTTKSSNFKKHIKWVIAIGGLLFVIELINLITNRALNTFSILPREVNSLPFIFTAPFLHGDFTHFLSNVFTLCIFAFLLLQYGTRRFISVTLGVMLLTGILVWIFGREAFHLGASGVVYGYFGYLLFAGFLSKKLSLIFISILIGFLYGGIVWGVLPIIPGVSWESHLFGFLSGLVLAYWWRTK